MHRLPAAILLTFLSISCFSALAQQSGRFRFDFALPEQGGEVQIQADHQEIAADEYLILSGNVSVVYGDVKVAADKVTWNERTRDVVAEGNVIIDQGTRRLTARRMVYNLATETGTLFDASASLEPSIYFRGEKIEKIAEDTYRLSDGIFTSCDIDDPAWSFQVGSGVVTLDEYARLRNVSFRAGKLPIFWTPYIVWPTKQDRARGFLTPSVGFRSRLGSYLGTSYFIPIGESADVTLLGDAHTEGYYGLGTEVRYVPSRNVQGKLSAYAVTDPEFDHEIEWKYAYTHKHEGLPGGFRGVIDVRDFSDLDFFRFYEREFETNTISNIYSSAYLTKNTSNYSLNIRTERREHYLSAGQTETFEQLPAVQFNTYPKRVFGTPLYFSLESSASRLRTSQGADYFRGDVFPTLSLQVKTPSWFSVKPQISLRETWYTASRDPLTRVIEDESLTRSYAQGQVEMTGPSFSRIYAREMGGFSRFKHVIEPRARWVYTSEVEDQERVVRFDSVDSPRLPLVSESVEYELVNRIIAKEKGERGSAREIVSLSLAQSVSLGDPYRQAVGGTLVETDRTPIRVNLHVNPYQAIALDAGIVWGNITEQVDQVNVSANLVEAGGERYVNFTWFSRFAPPGATSGDSSQFRVNTGLPLLRDRLRIDAAVNYDATRDELLEQRWFMRFNASCYNIGFEFRDFIEYRTGAPRRNRDYRLSIDLKNVGSFPINLPGSIDSLFQ